MKFTAMLRGRSRWHLPLAAAVSLMFLAACGASTSLPPTPTEPLPTAAAPPTSIAELQAALEAAGKQVQLRDRLESRLATAAREFIVGGEKLDVYQVPSSANRDLLAAALAETAPDQPAPSIWISTGLVVAYGGGDGGTRLLLSGLLGDPLEPGATGQDEPYPPAVLAAIDWVARQAEVPPADVEVLSFNPEAWEDDCLGLAEPDESCGGQSIDGWQVVLQADGTSFELHTDSFGERIRTR